MPARLPERQGDRLCPSVTLATAVTKAAQLVSQVRHLLRFGYLLYLPKARDLKSCDLIQYFEGSCDKLVSRVFQSLTYNPV